MVSVSLRGTARTSSMRRFVVGTDIPSLSLPLAALVAMFAYTWHLNHSVLGYVGSDLLLSSAVPLILAAMAQACIISLGDIDLGLGYFVGLANCVIAVIMQKSIFAGLGLLLLLVIAYGIQGLIVTLRRVPSITFTLGASFVWLGLGHVIAPTPSGQAPGWLSRFFLLHPPLMPLSAWLILGTGAVGYLVFFRTRIGLQMRAAGSNEDAFTTSGSSLVRTRVLAYMLAGLFAVGAGLAVTGITGSGDATASADYTLLAIAAVILGGASFSGGKVSAPGVVAGALVLSLAGSVMAQLNVSSSLQTGVEGLILLAAIAGRRFLRRRTT